MRVFEVYECGDPYSRAWDCTEYADAEARESGVNVQSMALVMQDRILMAALMVAIILAALILCGVGRNAAGKKKPKKPRPYGSIRVSDDCGYDPN